VTRRRQASAWLADALRERFGREGLRRAGSPALPPGASPFRELDRLARRLSREIFGDSPVPT
jgi:LAO/AO transport system kinase